MTKNTAQQSDLLVDVAQPDDEIVTLPPAKRAELALNSSKTERDLLALLEKHQGIKAIKDKAGRDQAHGAYMEVKNARVDIEAVSKGARDDAVQFSKAVIAEEKRLVAVITGEEARLKALRDGWDAEQERIKREAAEREQARIKALKQRIQDIKDLSGLAMQCRTSERVQGILDRVQAIDLTDMQEFAAEAEREKTNAVGVVTAIYETRVSQEAEAARIKAERDALEAAQAEAKRLADEQAAIAASLAAEREAFEREKAAFEAAKAPAPAPEPEKVVFAVPESTPVHISKPVREAMENLGADVADLILGDETTVLETTPSAESLIYRVAQEFGVSPETACTWLIERADDFEVWQAEESAATA